MPHVLDNMVVFDPEGRRVRLGQLWADRIAVLVFVRHFGCVLCRQQIGDITPLFDRVKAMGADLIVVGQGSVEEARTFRDRREAEDSSADGSNPPVVQHAWHAAWAHIADHRCESGARVHGLALGLPSIARRGRSASAGRRCGDRTGRRGTLPVHQPGGGRPSDARADPGGTDCAHRSSPVHRSQIETCSSHLRRVGEGALPR